MKKLAALLFICFYVVSVSGASFHLHFCGNSLERISFAGFGHEGCCCGKTMTKKNCCKDKLVSFESLKDYQKDESVATVVGLPDNNPVLLAGYAERQYNFYPVFIRQCNHAPPDPPDSRQIRISYSVFRI